MRTNCLPAIRAFTDTSHPIFRLLSEPTIVLMMSTPVHFTTLAVENDQLSWQTIDTNGSLKAPSSYHLLSCPPEVLASVLAYLDPYGQVKAALTCRQIYSVVLSTNRKGKLMEIWQKYHNPDQYGSNYSLADLAQIQTYGFIRIMKEEAGSYYRSCCEKATLGESYWYGCHVVPAGSSRRCHCRCWFCHSDVVVTETYQWTERYGP